MNNEFDYLCFDMIDGRDSPERDRDAQDAQDVFIQNDQDGIRRQREYIRQCEHLIP